MNAFTSDDRDPDSVARSGTERVVHELVRAQYGPDAIVSRPLSEKSTFGIPTPADYTTGITAARQVAAVANQMVLDYARKARGEGRAWRELAGPLGVGVKDEDDDFTDPAAAAFELVAGEPLRQFDRRWVSWRCVSCTKYIHDKGPYNGNPIDDETGHTEDCARHTAEIRAYEARINGMDGEDLG